MGSPAGIFVGLSAATLAQIQSQCIEQAVNGRVTSESAGAKTEGRQFDLPVTQALIEVNYALAKLNHTLPSRKVVNVLTDYGRGYCR